jgi:Kae1-associated kinase Bud32
MKPKILAHGAEAIIFQENNKIIKDRIKKSYRLNSLDQKIRKRRTKREAKILQKAQGLIPVPKLIDSDDKGKIQMQFIVGKKLSDHLDSIKNSKEICKVMGKQIAILHDSEIIHGDLTTSNIIWGKDEKLYFIDFGLSFHSSRLEDKATDMHLIKQALEAKHYQNFDKFFKAILEGYKTSKYSQQVIKQLEKVEKRGRYKQQY